jgi:squalene synthase HpnC
VDLNLRAADAYCQYLTKGHYENFIVSFGVLDAGLRRDLSRFYAYCRTTDDLGDESGSYAGVRLQRWDSEVRALFAGEPPNHPVLIALAQTIQRRSLPAQPFYDLIAANLQDQEITGYESWPELEAYCMLSAAPVGRIVLQLFGIEGDEAVRLSDDVCIGLQIANHAQDVSRDAAIGRSYLLGSDVRAGGVRCAVRALCQRARALLASGKRLESMAPFALRFQLALYRLGGVAICDAIEGMDYATDTARPRITTVALAGVLVRAFIEALTPGHTIRDAEPA